MLKQIYKLKELFKKKPVFLVPPTAPYEIAFECGGRTYWKYTDEKSLPHLRWCAALDVIEQMQMKLDKDYLNAYFDAVMHACNTGKISDIAVITRNAKDSLNYVFNVRLMYNLAAVMYIDMEHENPNDFDPVFAEEKIKLWMEYKDVESFFLSKPIINYLPQFDIFNTTIEDYIQKELLVREKNLNNISHVLSSSVEYSDTKKSLLKQKEMYSKLKK